MFVTETPDRQIEFPSLEHFEEACSNTDFEFDVDVGALPAEASQDLRQPTVGKIFTRTNSQSSGVMCAR
jgi:hypothetical protein